MRKLSFCRCYEVTVVVLVQCEALFLPSDTTCGTSTDSKQARYYCSRTFDTFVKRKSPIPIASLCVVAYARLMGSSAAIEVRFDREQLPWSSGSNKSSCIGTCSGA